MIYDPFVTIIPYTRDIGNMSYIHILYTDLQNNFLPNPKSTLKELYPHI